MINFSHKFFLPYNILFLFPFSLLKILRGRWGEDFICCRGKIRVTGAWIVAPDVHTSAAASWAAPAVVKG